MYYDKNNKISVKEMSRTIFSKNYKFEKRSQHLRVLGMVLGSLDQQEHGMDGKFFNSHAEVSKMNHK